MIRTLKVTLIKMKGIDVTEVQNKLFGLKLLKSAIDIDGVYGNVTANAVRDWQKKVGRPLTGNVTPEDKYVMGILKEPKSSHFALKEFNICAAGRERYWADCPKDYWDDVQELFDRLEKFRTALNTLYAKPNEEIRVHIKSGYRCKAYNTIAGGATSSRHMSGDAADIYCDVIDKTTKKTLSANVNPYQMAKAYMDIYKNGGIGLGAYSTIHVDHRPNSSMVTWWYNGRNWTSWKASYNSWKSK